MWLHYKAAAGQKMSWSANISLSNPRRTPVEITITLFLFLLYVVCDMFPCKIPYVLLEFGGSQNLDVVGQSHVEPSNSF